MRKILLRQEDRNLQGPLLRLKRSCLKLIYMQIVTKVRTRESPTTRLEATILFTLEKHSSGDISLCKSLVGATFQLSG